MVEGLSFHVGSQCTNFAELRAGAEPGRRRVRGSQARGLRAEAPRHRRRFPRALRRHRASRSESLARTINAGARPAVSPADRDSRRAGPIPRGHRRPPRCATVIGKAVRDGKQCYYLDDGVYHTFSGIIFDHCQYHVKSFKKGPTQICSVFGPTCDALDTISLAEELPDLDLGDYGLHREHRRLFGRQQHVLQRISAGARGASESVNGD